MPGDGEAPVRHEDSEDPSFILSDGKLSSAIPWKEGNMLNICSYKGKK